MRRLAPDDPAIPAVLALIREAFAGMEGRIDPPSSMHRLTVGAISAQAAEGEVWVIEDPAPVACIFLTPKPPALYLGKLAVTDSHRGRGLARLLVARAEASARERGLTLLELQTRIELVENHATFARLGFVRAGETAHPGHDRPTSLTLRRPLGPATTAPMEDPR